MKRKKLFAACLALLMLLSLAPMALAAELPFDAAWLQGVSLRNLINEGQGQIDLAGGSFLLENVLFLEENVVDEELELCICEVSGNFTSAAQLIPDMSMLPPGCEVELRHEQARLPDAKDGNEVAEEIRLEKAGQKPAERDDELSPADRGREADYLYLTGTPERVGNFIFVVFDGKLRLVEVEVLKEKPAESTTVETPAVTEAPAVTETPVVESTWVDPFGSDSQQGGETPNQEWADTTTPATPAPATPAPAYLPAPTVTVTGAGTVKAGESMVLEAQVQNGYHPGYQWYRWDGADWSAISGATESSYRPDTAGAGTFAYLCQVTNYGDTGESASANSDYVTVTVEAAAPAQPQLPTPRVVGITGSTRVEQGENAVLEVQATNTFNASYQWYEGQTPIEDGSGNSAQYRPDTSAAGTQVYTVLVVNNGNTGETTYAVSDPVTFTVEAKPTLPTPTVSITGSTNVTVGENAVLEAKVQNGYNLSYQWFTSLGYYDAPLRSSDAQSSRFRPDTATAGTQTYFCRVTSSGYGEEITVDSDPVTFTVTQRETRKISSVKIDSLPTKTNYTDGETLDTTGLRLLVQYSDGTYERVSSGFTAAPTVIRYNNTSTANIAVRYQGYTLTYQINVRSQQQSAAERVRGISVLTMPNKTSYTVGEYLDTTGLKIRVYSNDGQYLDIGEGFECSPTRFNGTGNQTVTVSFLGKTCNFTVAVKEPRRVYGLTILTLPANRSYAVGDTISAAGIVLQLQTNNGYETITSGYSISPRVASAVGTQMVTVTYEGLSANYNIEVHQNNIPRVSATPAPTPYAYATPTPNLYVTPSPNPFSPVSPTPLPGVSATPLPTVPPRPSATPAPARRNTGVGTMVKVLFGVAVLALGGLIGYVLYLRKHDVDEEAVLREEKPSEKVRDLFSKFNKNGKDQ